MAWFPRQLLVVRLYDVATPAIWYTSAEVSYLSPSRVSAPPSKFSLSHFFLRLCWNATVSSPPIDLSFITLGKAITLISLSLKVNKQLDHFNYFPK